MAGTPAQTGAVEHCWARRIAERIRQRWSTPYLGSRVLVPQILTAIQLSRPLRVFRFQRKRDALCGLSSGVEAVPQCCVARITPVGGSHKRTWD
jgi:hypothetical protein